jgi:tetratricopeptide (TPR) repeat protein
VKKTVVKVDRSRAAVNECPGKNRRGCFRQGDDRSGRDEGRLGAEAGVDEALLRRTPTPIVELNAAVAVGLATNLKFALDWIERIEGRAELTNYYLLPASKADVLRRLGRHREAVSAYRAALELVSNPAERRYLQRRLDACAGHVD